MLLPSGCVIAGVGGIEEGQREANYHRMAYVDADAVLRVLDQPVDIIITHQGPSEVQAHKGSPTLQVLLESTHAKAWFHGHSVVDPEPRRAGPDGTCLVVPLGDIAFPGRSPDTDEPGPDGWCIAHLHDDRIAVRKEPPPFLKEFRRKKWTATDDGRLICPALSELGWR